MRTQQRLNALIFPTYHAIKEELPTKPSDLVYNIQIVPYEDEILGKDPLIQTFSTYDKAKDYFDQIIGIYGQKYTYRVFVNDSGLKVRSL